MEWSLDDSWTGRDIDRISSSGPHTVKLSSPFVIDLLTLNLNAYSTA